RRRNVSSQSRTARDPIGRSLGPRSPPTSAAQTSESGSPASAIEWISAIGWLVISADAAAATVPTVGSGARLPAYSSLRLAVTPARASAVPSTSTPNRHVTSSQLTPRAIRETGTPLLAAASTHTHAAGAATTHGR